LLAEPVAQHALSEQHPDHKMIGNANNTDAALIHTPLPYLPACASQYAS
jgi:hypothetical protein